MAVNVSDTLSPCKLFLLSIFGKDTQERIKEGNYDICAR